MNVVLQERAKLVEQQRESIIAERAAFRMHWMKIVCGIAIGICFWFSVPYYLPLKVDPDPMKAAANEAQAYEGNFSRQVAMPIIMAISLWMLWRFPRRGRFGNHLMYFPLLYIGWALVSFAWSEDPAITMKRLVVFAIDALFAFTLARTLSVIEMALLGFAATGTVGFFSLYVDSIQERIFAPFDPDYRFTGVMTANYQAMNLLVCIVCALTLVQRRPKWVPFIAPAVGLALALLYITRARLSAFICIVLMAIMLTRIVNQRYKAQTRALIFLCSLAVVVPVAIFMAGRNGASAAQNVFMMGRTDTQNTSNLSNRAPLWSELMESVERTPWLGFGYEAFWTPMRVERVSADQGWMVPNAHDSYLDQVLSLGYIGALLYTCMLLGAVFVGWRRFFRARSESTLLPAILLTWLALTGLAESTPLDPYLPTMLAYACIAKMCMIEGTDHSSNPDAELLLPLPSQV